MLNLRQVNPLAGWSEQQSTGQKSTIRFNAEVLVGNMGESIRFGEDSEEAVEHITSGEPTSIEMSPMQDEVATASRYGQDKTQQT